MLPCPVVSAHLTHRITSPPQAKRRPGHAGTITVTQLGIKWVKSGQFNGALYGINRVLFSSSHENGPFFSFIVRVGCSTFPLNTGHHTPPTTQPRIIVPAHATHSLTLVCARAQVLCSKCGLTALAGSSLLIPQDKNVSRFICHCFECTSELEADKINSAIGRSFTVLTQTQALASKETMKEAYQQFEDTKLSVGNLLSTHLDQGQGVDADEAMAALDAGFTLGGWSTPAVGGTEKAELGPMSPAIAPGRSRAGSNRSTGSWGSMGSNPIPPSRGGGVGAQPVAPRRASAKPSPRLQQRNVPANASPASQHRLSTTNPFAAEASNRLSSTNPFAPAALVPQAPGSPSLRPKTSLKDSEAAKAEQAAFDEVNKLIAAVRQSASAPTPAVPPAVALAPAPAVAPASNMDGGPSLAMLEEMRQAAIDEVNKRIADQIAAAKAKAAPDPALAAASAPAAAPATAPASAPLSPSTLSPAKLKLQQKKQRLAELKAKRLNSANSVASQSPVTPDVVEAPEAVSDAAACHPDVSAAEAKVLSMLGLPAALSPSAVAAFPDPAPCAASDPAAVDATEAKVLSMLGLPAALSPSVVSPDPTAPATVQAAPTDTGWEAAANPFSALALPAPTPPAEAQALVTASDPALEPAAIATLARPPTYNPYEAELSDDAADAIGTFGISTTEQSSEWNAEEAALEEAMREIRARLEAEDDDAVPLDAAAAEEDKPSAIESFPGREGFSSRSPSKSPSRKTSVTSVAEPLESGGPAEAPLVTPTSAPVAGFADLALAMGASSGQVVQSGERVVMPMSFDADLDFTRPSLGLRDMRPGGRGFTVVAKVIQQVFRLQGTGPHEVGIAEWLIADSTASAILKTVQPATATLQPGCSYEMIGCAVTVVQEKMRLTIGRLYCIYCCTPARGSG